MGEISYSRLAGDCLRAILPDDCKARYAIGGEIIAYDCLKSYLEMKRWDSKGMGTIALYTQIAEGNWKIPENVHNKICKCRNNRRPRNRKESMERVNRLIDQMELPHKDEPGQIEGVSFYAEAGGTKMNPVIYLRFFFDEKSAVAYYNLISGRWMLASIIKRENGLSSNNYYHDGPLDCAKDVISAAIGMLKSD